MASDCSEMALKGEHFKGHSQIKNDVCQSRALLLIMKFALLNPKARPKPDSLFRGQVVCFSHLAPFRL